jgi:hypothetical protein
MRRAMLVSAMVALLALVPVVHGAHYERLEHTDTIPQFDLDVSTMQPTMHARRRKYAQGKQRRRAAGF